MAYGGESTNKMQSDTWLAHPTPAQYSGFTGSLPPVANLFPGALAAIDQDLNSIRLDPDESIGLGLAMAKETLRLHDRELVIASTPGLGTRCRLTLPAAPTQPAPRTSRRSLTA